MNSTQTARLAPANYRVHSIRIANGQTIALDQTYQACLTAGLVDCVASLARLQQGSTYSGQDFDVQSAALSALRKAGVDTKPFEHAHVYNNCAFCNEL